MRTTTLMLAAAAAAIGVLVPVAEAQSGAATTASCLDCPSFDQQQCEANNGHGECVWSGRSDADRTCIVDHGEGCKGCGCDPEGSSAGLIFVGVLLLIIGTGVACCMFQCDEYSCCDQKRTVIVHQTPRAVMAAPVGPPPTQVPAQFSVTVPPGVQPGQSLQVQSPNTGMTLMVPVPPGCQAGMSFAVLG